MISEILTFVRDTHWDDFPADVRAQTELNVLDLIGTAVTGSQTELSGVIRRHALAQFGSPAGSRILFDGQRCSPAGAALAGGMTIDAIDCHDGYNPVKGHIGCGLLPAILAVADQREIRNGAEIMTAVTMGYEIGGRLGKALHSTVPDYHTSGAWVAVAAAAAAARLMNLPPDQIRHAMGIAEYHGPRSQMMRCIDHPTMLKDGSGWGSMSGVSAAYLAEAGFTGAPALTAEAPEVSGIWQDLGQYWISKDQYYKPYPVCRWAQGPIECILALKKEHGFTSHDVDHIEVSTFHESVRLATSSPKTTEEAQYSTSYPCAAALVRGTVEKAEISETSFKDPEIQRISTSLRMNEDAKCNEAFPERRYAKAAVHLKSGTVHISDYLEPKWSPTAQPSESELREKFHVMADPIIGPKRAEAIENSISAMAEGQSSVAFENAIYPEII